jgi:hypothetical protein
MAAPAVWQSEQALRTRGLPALNAHLQAVSSLRRSASCLDVAALLCRLGLRRRRRLPGLLAAAPMQARLAAALARVPDGGRPAAALAVAALLHREADADAAAALCALLRLAVAQQARASHTAAEAVTAMGCHAS